MKIAILNTTDTKGAGKAAYRLWEAIKGNGSKGESHFIVQKRKGGRQEGIIPLKASKLSKIPYLIRSLFENYLIKRYNKQTNNFSLGLFGIHSMDQKLSNYQVIHLHWINDNFISLKELERIGSLNKPVFWTLHDLWPITGGCHYNANCRKFEHYCHHCPELNSGNNKDLSYKTWSQKKLIYDQLQPIFIAPSQWMAKEIEKSSLGSAYPVHVIPNGIDHQMYKPRDKAESRRYFNLPYDKKLILFGAVNAIEDDRKGFNELVKSLQLLDDQIDLETNNIELLVFGNQSESISESLSTKIHYLGPLSTEEALINCYNAANFLVIPSKQDNLPNTIMEALACGTPCIGFNTGGIPEMIEHGKTGFIAETGNSQDLAKKIKSAINLTDDEFYTFKEACREKVLTNYTYSHIANQHLTLYQEYLSFYP